jgi:hypothetical protein
VVEQHDTNIDDTEPTVRGSPGMWPVDSSRAVTQMLDATFRPQVIDIGLDFVHFMPFQ